MNEAAAVSIQVVDERKKPVAKATTPPLRKCECGLYEFCPVMGGLRGPNSSTPDYGDPHLN